MPPIMNRAMKVIIPLIIGAIGVDVLFYLFGTLLLITIDVWLILVSFLVFYFLYTQIDIARARKQKGIETDILNYLWLPVVIPLTGILMILFPGVIVVPFFLFIALLISMEAMFLLWIYYEMEHPGWFALWLDEDGRRIIKQTRATRKAMTDDGARQVAYGFLYLGIALGAELGMLIFMLMLHELFWLLVGISALMGAAIIFGYMGAWRVKKSCIDRKPL